MRMEIGQWMKNLAFFHVLTTAVLHILPDKRYEQYIRLFMGLLLVLLICTPVFAIAGKSEVLLEEFRKNYGKEEQERMETEAEGIREVFLKNVYEEELKKQVQKILRQEGVDFSEIDVDMGKTFQVVIKLSGMITEKQREAVENELRGICGLEKDQYQILDAVDGVEGVGNSASSGASSYDRGTSGIPEKQ